MGGGGGCPGGEGVGGRGRALVPALISAEMFRDHGVSEGWSGGWMGGGG